FDGSGSSDPDGTIMACPWTFGDGGSAAGMSVSHAFATAGNYTVTLTVTDNKGMTARDTALAGITNRPPVANAGPDQTTSPGTALTLNGTGSSDPDGTITSYGWNFGDGGSGTGATVSHPYATAGTYTATLTVTDNSGAQSSDTAVITVAGAATGQFVWHRDLGGPNWGDVAMAQGVAAGPDGSVEPKSVV